jgi:hypothetical protein
MFLDPENAPFPEILRIAPKVRSVAVQKLAPETTVDLCRGAALGMMRLSPNIVEHNRFIAGCGDGLDGNILLRVTLATVVLRPQV